MLRWLFLLVFAVVPYSYGETINIAVSQSASTTFESELTRLSAALSSNGFNVTVHKLPDERSLVMVTEGMMQIEFMRIPQAIEPVFSQLVRIDPPVSTMKFSMFVANDKKFLCDLDKADLAPLTVVGVRGIRFYETHIYPDFAAHIVSPGTENSFQIVLSERADVGFWLTTGFDQFDPQLTEQIHRCDFDSDGSYEVSIHSYLHRSFSHLLPRLQPIYQQVFGDE